jgi:hypothetical protein
VRIVGGPLYIVRIVGANDMVRDDRIVDSSQACGSGRPSLRRVHILHFDIWFSGRLCFADGQALAEDFGPGGWLVLTGLI